MEEFISETTVAEAEVTGVPETEAVATAKKPRKPINQQKLQDNIWGWAFCAPLIIGTAFFVFFAFVVAILLSFSNYTQYNGKLFEFLGNIKWAKNDAGDISPFYWYAKMFTATGGNASGTIIAGDGETLWKTLFNTVFYMIGIPIGMVLSMVFAVLMSRDIKGGGVFRIIYYIPCVSSTVAVTYTFQLLFQNNGVINTLFGSDVPWLKASGIVGIGGDSYWGGGIIMKIVVIIMSVWKGLGGTIILFCAGLSGVNAATKEAASIDGANAWMIFWKVTMPDLAPTIFYTIVTSVIGGMQIYTEPQLLFGSTFVNTYTDGYVAMIFYRGISSPDIVRYGYACALGMVLFVIILILTLIQFKMQNNDN